MPQYQKLIIYFFSGTGNSKNVARWLSDVALEKNIETQLINIAHIDRRSIEPPDPTALIAFVSPTHGFNYPPIMIHFIRHFPKGNNKVLMMNTRAGMLIGKFVTPGLSGIALYFSALILILKGFSIKGMFPVDLPSNWVTVHPFLNERTVTYLHEKNKMRVSKFANKVISGKSDFTALRDIIQDLLIAPVSLGYYFIGRFFFAKTYYASKDCDNCDICIKNCPAKAIIKIDNRPYWTFNCESCMRCISNCPKKAIEIGHGFVLVISLIYSLIFIDLFYKYFSMLFYNPKHSIIGFILENLLFFGLITIGYRLFHYLMRFMPIERMMVYTSLTKYKFWGRRYGAKKEK